MKLQILFRLAIVGLPTFGASQDSLPAQEVLILHGPNAKNQARRIERKLPKALPSRLYNAGLLALADEAGQARLLSRINSARVLVLVGRGAARLLGEGKLTVPVIALNTPVSDVTTSGGSVIVWSDSDAPEHPKLRVVPDLEDFAAPDPESGAQLAAEGPFVPDLVAACVVGWIPELQRPVLIVHGENPVADLPRAQVVHLFHKRQQLWPDKQRVELFLPPRDSHAFSELLRVVYKTDARALERLWSQRLYTNRITAIPRHMTSERAAIATVMRRRRALCIVPASAIPRHADVAVLTIDGLNFLSEGYLFR